MHRSLLGKNTNDHVGTRTLEGGFIRVNEEVTAWIGHFSPSSGVTRLTWRDDTCPRFPGVAPIPELDVDHLPADTLDYVADAAFGVAMESGRRMDRVIGMGVAVSAPVQRVSHALRTPSMLREWTDVDIAGELGARVGVPVHVGNDANLGALAEWRFGVGRRADDLIYLMLSDGVGAGLILNGRPYEGAAGAAGELGHVTVVDGGYVCRCGNRGCLETVVGARALVAAVSHTRGPEITLADVLDLAVAGDPGCQRVIIDAGRTVGRALSGICAVLDPKLVIIGGALAAAGPPLLDGVREILSRRLPPAISQGVVVRSGALGDRAEALGAVALAARFYSPGA